MAFVMQVGGSLDECILPPLPIIGMVYCEEEKFVPEIPELDTYSFLISIVEGQLFVEIKLSNY